MDCSASSVTSLPEEFTCPISMGIMKNPMRHKVTGHCFERESIMNWLYLGNTKCPLTRKPLHTDDLVLDTDLQAKIQEFMIEQEISESRRSEEDVDNFFDDDSDDFESTMDDILEITARIRNVTMARNGRSNEEAPARTTQPCPLSAVHAPKVPPTKSLSDIRMRVLQRRDDRIKSVISKADPSAPTKASDISDMSLAQLMTSRM